ncbi:MAG: metallophosphoesterase [Bacteroidales bacterium]|nr:metallophosphoesterase [Bacteroidales bacterium]
MKNEKKNKDIIVLGDIHGTTLWKEVVAQNPDCCYVFLGDYLDPYIRISDNLLIENLNEIIEFKKKNSKDVVLLLGNHDGHYFSDFVEQATRYNEAISTKVAKIFKNNISLFQNAFQIENLLFTHAGVSQKWFVNDFKGKLTENIAEQLNSPTPDKLPAIGQCGEARGGFHECGGIYWADESELEYSLQNYIQFVGHTRVLNKIMLRDNIWFCDALWEFQQYLKISSDLQTFDVCKMD